MLSPNLSNFCIQIFTIALTFAFAIGKNDQIKVKCDSYKLAEEDTACIINQTAIIHPESVIQHDDLDNLNVVKITGMGVEHLPIELDLCFPKLHQYFVDKASFTKIEKKNLKNLKNLVVLILKSKSCKEVEKNSFEDLENLTFLNLGDSSIEYFHSDTFKPLKNLEVLHLLGNNLEILHPHAFDTLIQLSILSFARNKLITLSRQLFLNKSELRVIDGYNNNYAHLDEITFDGLKLENLNLYQTGDCSLHKYQLSKDQQQKYINIDEVKQDIRDDCKGSDFLVYKIHARMLDVVHKHGDRI